MTIYNINLGIGWASSGVEYAQAYRAGIFRSLDLTSKFIFTDLILADNIQHLTANIGFADDQVIWLYNHFTDIKLAPTSVTVEDVLASFAGLESHREQDGKVLRVYFSDEDKFVTCYLVDSAKNLVQHAEYVFGGNLIRKDYFSYTRYCTEYFAPKDQMARLYQRSFFNEDGSTAYDILLTEGQEEVYRFKDRILYGKPALMRYFMQRLNLSKSDFVILDRETGIGQAVFEEAQKAHLAVVVHAEHYSENASNEDYLLWNNYYEYQFTNADKVDCFIVSTDRQKEVLEGQFAQYSQHRPRIVTIPVGSIDQLTEPARERKPFSLITASRLAKEKHIDWLVKAVIQAHQVLPELTFDIYGSGGEESLLREIITAHQAENYIQLKGHADLAQIYPQYEVYLTASTSEGFGLTLMEAVGSGLPLIGFDVPYGNQTFIQDGQNGYLIPSSDDHVETAIKRSFAEKICQLYQENHLPDMRIASYDLAREFLTDKVRDKWKKTIEEVLHDSTI